MFYKIVEYIKVVWIPTKCCSWTTKQRKAVVFPGTTSQERKPVPWGERPVWPAQCPHSQNQEAVSWPPSLPVPTRLGWAENHRGQMGWWLLRCLLRLPRQGLPVSHRLALNSWAPWSEIIGIPPQPAKLLFNSLGKSLLFSRKNIALQFISHTSRLLIHIFS